MGKIKKDMGIKVNKKYNIKKVSITPAGMINAQ